MNSLPIVDSTNNNITTTETLQSPQTPKKGTSHTIHCLFKINCTVGLDRQYSSFDAKDTLEVMKRQQQEAI
jgi:hypothetical protein